MNGGGSTPQRLDDPRGKRAPDDIDDPALVAALRAGDRSAFERIIRGQGGALLRVARRMLGNDEDAREALQDAFVSAFRASGRFEGASRISTWLHRIVVNSCLMRLRTRRRTLEISIDEWLPTYLPDGHHEATFVDWSNAAHERLEQQEIRAVVRGCIDRLPDSYRVVLLMRDIEDMSSDEVAATLGISRNAVNVRLHRARQALRTLLDQSFVRGQLQ